MRGFGGVMELFYNSVKVVVPWLYVFVNIQKVHWERVNFVYIIYASINLTRKRHKKSPSLSLVSTSYSHFFPYLLKRLSSHIILFRWTVTGTTILLFEHLSCLSAFHYYKQKLNMTINNLQCDSFTGMLTGLGAFWQSV